MSRDALLVVLALAVVVNFAFLARVAVLQRRRREAAGAAIAGRASPVARAATESPAATSTPRDRERAAAEAWRGDAQGDAPRGPQPSDKVVAATGGVAGAGHGAAEPARADATSGAAVDLPAAATQATTSATTSAAVPGAADAPGIRVGKGADAAANGEPMTRPTSRTRRFAMPRVEEDRGRTEAAIGAFLGEPSLTPGTAQAHRPRRRSRRQRTPGEVPLPPTVVVATLAGWDELRHLTGRDGAVRFSEALGNAIRGTIRSGDELMELGDGRLRIVVHADEGGARALIMRAATLCDPWLRAAPVPLSLRARTVGSGAVAASTNGRSSASPVPDPASRQRAATAGRSVPPADRV